MTRVKSHIENKQGLFIPFIMAGDPSPEVTIELALTLQDAGAHVIELGIPYSDPLADGPVIQRSAKRALAHGMSLQKALELVPQMRKRGLTVPVIIFTYFNPLLQFGEERFMEAAKQYEVDGLLVPDLPYEESEKVASLCKEAGLSYISLVAPTSKARVEMIASEAQGFLYCVSSLGVTGVRNEFSPSVFEFLEDVKKHSPVPIAVGFGISNKEQVDALSSYCDGIIVGSAITKLVEEHETLLLNENTRKEGLEQIKRFVLSLIS
ncbi:tryptophan synthase subunit alpha [Bacillus alkalicellulosilyticus]|uniref:tryptophan synthase subunit alpha n=1 Tax=Alkalihalobacterium alkalicellulosilyticum TaxID=1912214 RepID=UPI000995E813|nr:tryptophan synthase subunit alpha [Bacillus alkalicellulosilyticus]